MARASGRPSRRIRACARQPPSGNTLWEYAPDTAAVTGYADGRMRIGGYQQILERLLEVMRWLIENWNAARSSTPPWPTCCRAWKRSRPSRNCRAGSAKKWPASAPRSKPAASSAPPTTCRPRCASASRLLAEAERLPASQLVTLALARFLQAFDAGQIDLASYKQPSASPRYDWNLVFTEDLVPPVKKKKH